MSALRKTMVYLGLADEDEGYEDDRREEPGVTRGRDEDQRDRHPEDHEERHGAAVTPLRRPTLGVVGEPAAAPARITTIHPRSYNDAKSIGESFRQDIPVIMNLTDMSDADAKRLVDFSAGLVFGLRGSIDRVTSKVFLLTPADVTVTTGEDVEDVPPAGFYNQS